MNIIQRLLISVLQSLIFSSEYGVSPDGDKL
jgi:hypothetical protein